jgi:HK97 family phage major capsid protein
LNTLEASATDKLASAEQRYLDLLSGVESRIAQLPDTASAEDVDRISAESQPRLDSLEAEVTAAKRQLESAERITRAREASAHLIPQGERIEVREPDTYDPRDTSRSWFADLYAARHRGDSHALARLQRNNREVDASVERRGLSFQTVEQRAAFVSADFYPPAWMADLWTSTKRQRRVVAQLCQNLPLAPHGNTIEVPAYTAPSSAVDVQTADGQAVTSNAGSTAQLTAPVTTVAGYLDVPRQMVSRGLPGLDLVIFADLSKDYNRKIDNLVLYGNGSLGSFQGVTLNSGIGSITYSSGAPTAASLTLKLADALQRIQTAVFEGADGIILHPRRFGAMIGMTDTAGRPLMVVSGQGPTNALAVLNSQSPPFGQTNAEETTVRPSGWLLGVPCYVDANITTTTGVGTNEDQIIVGSWQNSVLFEPTEGPSAYTFEGVASANVNLRLQIVGYASFIVRYPGAFVKIGGTSLATPSF